MLQAVAGVRCVFSLPTQETQEVRGRRIACSAHFHPVGSAVFGQAEPPNQTSSIEVAHDVLSSIGCCRSKPGIAFAPLPPGACIRWHPRRRTICSTRCFFSPHGATTGGGHLRHRRSRAETHTCLHPLGKRTWSGTLGAAWFLAGPFPTRCRRCLLKEFYAPPPGAGAIQEGGGPLAAPSLKNPATVTSAGFFYHQMSVESLSRRHPCRAIPASASK